MTSLSDNKATLFVDIESHRGYLIRFATARLREADAAEEVVQEALLAALDGCDSFAGGSTLRTWLTSILKFKIIDFQRRAVPNVNGLCSRRLNQRTTIPAGLTVCLMKPGTGLLRCHRGQHLKMRHRKKHFLQLLSGAWINCLLSQRGYFFNAKYWAKKQKIFVRPRPFHRLTVG